MAMNHLFLPRFLLCSHTEFRFSPFAGRFFFIFACGENRFLIAVQGESALCSTDDLQHHFLNDLCKNTDMRVRLQKY